MSSATVIESIVFYVAAISAVVSGIAVISARSPIYSALALILTLAQLAILYLLLNAQFIAAAQILIYAGAVMVLFLFVITLLGVQNYELIGDALPGQRVLSVALGGLLLAVLIFFVAQAPGAITGYHDFYNNALQQDNVKAFGTQLFTNFVFPFEVTALLLIVAMVGAVSLGRRRSAEFDSVLGRIEGRGPQGPDEPAARPVPPPNTPAPEREPQEV